MRGGSHIIDKDDDDDDSAAARRTTVIVVIPLTAVARVAAVPAHMTYFIRSVVRVRRRRQLVVVPSS
jgi:hypothetical protein